MTTLVPTVRQEYVPSAAVESSESKVVLPDHAADQPAPPVLPFMSQPSGAYSKSSVAAQAMYYVMSKYSDLKSFWTFVFNTNTFGSEPVRIPASISILTVCHLPQLTINICLSISDCVGGRLSAKGIMSEPEDKVLTNVVIIVKFFILSLTCLRNQIRSWLICSI